MSKIGQRKINLPEGVKVILENNNIRVSGPKGELSLELPKTIKVEKDENFLAVKTEGKDRRSRAFHGLYRQLIANMVEGVYEGFQKKLDFKGVGFRAEVAGSNLILNVGFSHLVEYPIKEGIEIKVEKNIITCSGIDRQKVGQTAAEIRAIRPVEPYKGKGIKYLDEIPRHKAGKAAKAAMATTSK